MTEIIYTGGKFTGKSHYQQASVLIKLIDKHIVFVGESFDFKIFDSLCEKEDVKYHKRKVQCGFILAINLQN